MLNKILLILGLDSSHTNLINALIDDATQEFKDYCNRDDVPQATEAVIVQMVICRYNRLKSEGLTSQSYSGVSESYIDGYPANILKMLNHYRKVKFV